MAIVNITSDSFFEGSRFQSFDAFDAFVEECIAKQVKFIDLGAHSTRPGYSVVSPKDQIERLAPFLDRLRGNYQELYVSIDTSSPEVANWALAHGADLINDVEGGRNHPEIFDVCAKYRAPYILVHSRGKADNLHASAQYHHASLDVMYELSSQIQKIKMAGVADIIIDLGFGFSKSLDENYNILCNLAMFQMLEFPILCGLSRKSMIYKKLHSTVENSLNGTTVLNTFAILQGATFLRVHDIQEASEILELLKIR